MSPATPPAVIHPTDRRRPLRRGLAAAAVAVVAAVVLAGCYTANQTKVVTLVNATRKSAGLRSVTANPTATSKAQAWAEHMSRTGVLEHTGGGSTLDTTGLPRWCSAAENVARATSIQNAHDLLVRSPAHRANMLGNYDRIGTGVARKGNDVWVVQIFYRAC